MAKEQTGGVYEKSNQSFLKTFNIRKVLNILREQGPLHRVGLAKMAQLDKKTITNIVNELFSNNQIRVDSTITQGSGRPKEMLSLNDDFCRCIGLDIGGTHITGVIMGFTGRILATHSIDLSNDLEPEVLVEICDCLIEQLLKKSNLTIEDLSGIGISFPGFIDRKTGRTILSENLPQWQNVSIHDLFAQKYGLEIHVDDCSKLMALAELWYGAGQGNDNFIVFDLGHGIGCGIVINKNIFTGSGGKSGEVGHTIVEVGGAECTCGRRGCIEAMASGWALTRQAGELLGHSKILRKVTKPGVDAPTIREIVLAAQLGDEDCKNLLTQAGRYIATGIANSITLLNPAKVIIGGRLIIDNDLLLSSIEENVKLQTIPEIYADASIAVSQLGMEASSMGAAILCFEKHFG